MARFDRSLHCRNTSAIKGRPDFFADIAKMALMTHLGRGGTALSLLLNGKTPRLRRAIVPFIGTLAREGR